MSSATASRQTLKKPVTPQASSRPSAPSLLLQRKSAEGDAAGNDEECDECKKGLGVQRLASGTGGPAVAPPIVHEVLRSPGQPLDARTRAFMEPRFGHDFSRVRVHTDAKAAQSAQVVAAHAYTVGSEVVFAENHYNPGNIAGQRLLAHELAHVVQQEDASASTTNSLTVGEPHDPLENHADRVAANVMREQAGLGDSSPITAHTQMLTGPAIQRQLADSPSVCPNKPNATPYPELSLGSTDPAVRKAQLELNAFHSQEIAKGAEGLPNCPLVADSVFGPKTSKAVIAFQQQAFPEDPTEWDGIVGPHTWAALGVTSVGGQTDGDVTKQSDGNSQLSNDSQQKGSADLAHYRFEIKAWIPLQHVPDPESPLHEAAFRLTHPLEQVADYISEYRGDSHSGYDGGYRVFQAVEFDWNGRTISNVAFPAVAHFGTSHRDFSAYLSSMYQFPSSGAFFHDTETATVDHAVTGSQQSIQEVDIGMSSPNPLTIVPAPNIDADYSLFISQDPTFGIETVTVRWTTDFMPNHGFRVVRNGIVVKERIVNAIPDQVNGLDIAIWLTNKTNGGAETFEPSSAIECP